MPRLVASLMRSLDREKVKRMNTIGCRRVVAGKVIATMYYNVYIVCNRPLV